MYFSEIYSIFFYMASSKSGRSLCPTLYKHVAHYQHTFRSSTQRWAAACVPIWNTQRIFDTKVCYCKYEYYWFLLLIESRVYSRNNTETCIKRNLGLKEPVCSGKPFSPWRNRPSGTCMKGNLPAAENFELLFRYRKVSLCQPPWGFLFVGVLMCVFGHLCVIFVDQQYDFFLSSFWRLQFRRSS